ncbi:hypothetical protein BKA57DRAFT_479241, partial [Linnemannia elongata]
MKFQASICMMLMSGAMLAHGACQILIYSDTNDVFACANQIDLISTARCMRTTPNRKEYWCFPEESYKCADVIAYKKAKCSDNVAIKCN